MTDPAFLKKVVAAVKFLSEAMPKQLLSVKDMHSTHLFCSDYFIELMGIKASQIIGKKILLSLYDNDPSFEEILIAEDQMIINSRETKAVLKINNFHNELVPYTCIKTPLINPETNHVVGLLVQGLEMGTALLQKHAINAIAANKKNAVISHSSKLLPKLGKREKQVIFFFMANLSSQEIAEMIYKIEGKKVAKSTIDSLFNDQLYAKFDVYSRPALYKKLQELGYDQLTPKELLSISSNMLDVVRIY